MTDKDDEDVPAEVQQLIDRMVAEGLLTKPDAEGKRSLTPKGKEVAHKAMLDQLEDGTEH